MKRHGFGGQPASHGQSLMHRGMGSAGGSQGSGSRVLPGKRMPGKMGNESVTVKNLKVLQVDDSNGIVVLNGCVPGPKNQIIKIADALGKPWPKGPLTVESVVETPVATEAVKATSAGYQIASRPMEPAHANIPPMATAHPPIIDPATFESSNSTARNGVQVDVKKRKRQFANRTKTGCGTCRRRKKKCDEAKPECESNGSFFFLRFPHFGTK